MYAQIDTSPSSLSAAIAAGWIDATKAEMGADIDYSDWAAMHRRPFVMVQHLAGRSELYVNMEGRKRPPAFNEALANVRQALLGDARRWEDAEFLLFDMPDLTAEAVMTHAAALGRALTEEGF